MLQVLQICHSYYPPFLDCARQYAVLFKDTQYKVTTVYLQGDFNQEVVDESHSDEVIFLGYQSHHLSGLKLGPIAKIKKLVAQSSFKFCIAHRVKSTYVALLATNLPVISVHHNYNDYSKWSRRLLVNYYQDRLLMLGVSNSVRDDLRQDLNGWSQDRIQTLYNRIDVAATKVQMLDKHIAREALNLPIDAYIFGNVGRLHYDKDQETLIKGFAKAYPDLPLNSLLVIVGAGPLELALKQLTLRLDIADQVVFAGKVPNAKQYFKAFDVFALTSDNEPFGMVLLEAMAAELPIICSDCGGGAEVVKGVGELFHYQSDDQLAQGLVKLSLQSPEEKNRLIINMQNKLHEYFSDKSARDIFFTRPWLKKIMS